MNLLDAVIFATKAHAGQTRKFSGEPFVLHPLRVAQAIERNPIVSDEVTLAAVLHDVVEDTPATLHDLREAGFSQYVVDMVDALSRRPGETYTQFIERVRRFNGGAAWIKLADIRDNLRTLPPEYKSLRKRYLKAIKVLEGN